MKILLAIVAFGLGVPQAISPQTEGVVLRLPVTGGIISGTIRDTERRPMVDARVEVVGLDGDRPPLGTTTDDRGNFRLFGLGPDRYLVVVKPETRSFANVPQHSYQPTYYPGTVDPDRALALYVGFGVEVSGVEFDIGSMFTVSVSGGLDLELPAEVDLGRNPALASSVTLYPYDSTSPGDPVGSGNRGILADGSFRIHGVPPGRYGVIARFRSRLGSTFSAHSLVDVGYVDFQGLRLVIRPGVEVHGEFVGEPTQVAAVRRVSLVLGGFADFPFIASASGGSSAFVLTNVPPGAYEIEVSMSSKRVVVTDVLQGGRSVLRDGITVGDQSPQPLQVILGDIGNVDVEPPVEPPSEGHQ